MIQRRTVSQDEMLFQRQLNGKKIPRQFCSLLFQYADVSFNNFELSPNSRVNWIDLENIESRFLLSSYGDGSIMIFDLFKPFDNHIYKNLAKIDRTVFGSHKMSVDCVQWYPQDTGMFVSCGADQTIRIWDTNEVQVAYKFEFQHKIYNFDISPSHALVSVTSKDSNLYLCDLKSGSKTHTLKGHQSSSLLTKWSPRNQNVLVSTSVLGEVYLWDIRKANSLLMKFSNGVKDAHNGAVNGLCFSLGGLYLITLSTDKTVGLWDFSNGTLSETRYGNVANDLCQPVRLSVSNCLQKDVVFVPSQETIKVFEIHTGKCTKTLSAHLMKTTSCDFNDNAMMLYSGSADTKILEWSYQKTKQTTQTHWEE
ncbi:DNA excision repair protein ERCC-8 isoform X2 [Hydra vulgaris]|uniref:DNA excision repair protein ERCC-8 isoform X2 n=1 Tax=Hydra vulgaris TaxID=6087 RepID=A0ABM4C213_HYDVU